MTNSLDTNFNQAPYWSDYAANSQQYNILFKPSIPVQARELNNLQFALQYQIGSFSNNIFTSGSIISGCNINLDPNLKYVKLNDNYANGAAATVDDFIGMTAYSNTTGLKASIYSANQGFIAQAPYLNTLYVKYLNTGYASNTSNLSQNVAFSAFQQNETLTILNTANVAIGLINVANNSVSGNSNTTGSSYAVAVDAGQIFQKGLALTVNKQNLVISPYTNQPNGISVGFTSIESILTAFEDPLLNDNAQGSPNYAAPGADRLIITPTLTIVNSATANNDFFSIIDFVSGQASIINQDTSYNVIGARIAEGLSDTNGDFIISPFNLSSQEALVANGDVDPLNFRLNISPGNGYIDGTKLNLLSTIFTNVRKGTDVNYQSQQILTAQMGNWILVDQLYGTIDPTTLPTLQLMASPSYGISNNAAKGVAVSSMANAASIGTATVIGFQPTNAPGTPSSAGYLYLTNINMNAGYSFLSVGGVYSNNNSRQFFGDVLEYNGSFGVNQPQYSALIYPLSSGLQSLKTAANTRDTQFQFQVGSGVTFNTAGQATINIPSFSGGVNELPFGSGNLTNSQLASGVVSVVAEANSAMANLTGSFTAPAACNVLTGSGTSWNTQLWTGATITLVNSSATELKMVSSVTNATSLVLVAPTVGSWAAGGNLHVSFLSGDILPLSLMVNASVDIINSSSMTVSLGNVITPSMAANVFYSVQRTAANPAGKTLQNSIWVSILCSENAGGLSGPWSLGVPDGYKLNHVYAGTTLANTNPDLVSEFTLINGQTDTYYGLAQLASNGFVANSVSQLLINFQAFLPNWTSGDGYFSIESYPIDDTGLTANTIFTQDIPQYYSIAAQQTYDLRTSMDFRFYAANTVAYANTIGSAPINPNTALTFNATNITPPIPDSEIETSYSYYMGRYDQVGLSSNGSIIFNEGIPSLNPVPPSPVINGMNIGTIAIPAYPTLTQDLITPALGSYPYVSFVYTTNKRYQMQDIGALDARITQVEYYTALSSLEQSVTNLLTQNQNGQSIFQNGIFADPMQNFALANCADPAFNIAIDSEMEVARPTFNQYPIPLTYNVGVGNTALEGDRIIILDPVGTTTIPFITQPFASQIRNCAQDITYTYNGTVYLTPDGNYQPDVTVNPAVVANINDYSNFASIADAWGTQWGTWNESTSSSTSIGAQIGIRLDPNSPDGADGLRDTTTTSTTTATQTGTQLVATPVYNTVQLGTEITSISLQPYAPASFIEFQAIGLKPSTQHYIYMNDVAQSQYAFQTDPTYETRLGAVGVLMSDATGTLYGIYYLPANTFNTGSLNFQVLDISNNVTELQDIQSQASATYYATNLAYTENNLELQTVTGQLSSTTVTQSTTSTSTSQGTQWYVDPIGQTFSILNTLVPDGSDCVYLNNITLYFNSKDPVLGVTIQVRPLTSSGLPDQYCLPYGSVHLTSSQVNTSQNSSVPTTVQFPDNLLLETGSNYCFIVIPDGSNPNYSLWTGVLGATNVLGGQIYSLSATGVMIMSSQAVTWTPYQTEAIKFSINVLQYPSSPVTGYASFINDNSEFFLISNTFGSFSLGDPLVLANMSNNCLALSNATISSVSNTITTGNTTGLGANSQVIVTSTNNQLGYLTSVVSVTNSSAFTANLRATANTTLASVFLANGNPSGIMADMTSNGSFMRISESTANSSNYLTNTYNYAVLDTLSGAFTTAGSLHDKKFNTLMAKFAPTIPGMSNMTVIAKTTSNSASGYVPDTAYSNLAIGVSSDFLSAEKAVLSRSNEVHYIAGGKSLFVNCNMTSNSVYQSPTLDSVKQAAWIVHNLVVAEDANNDVYTSEIHNQGTGLNRYISETINLASGMDAENFTVYLGCHWPAGTDVYVYAKLLNQYDPGTWQSKVWSPMVTQNSYRASPVNLADFTDYQFNFANTVMTNGTAYNDAANSSILTYQNNGVSYAGFVTFAVKVVLLSNNSPIVPMVTDLRAVATTSA